MSLKKRGNGWSLRFRPFGELVRIQLPLGTKLEAQLMKADLIKACRFGNFAGLSPMAEEIAISLYRKHKMVLPSAVAAEYESPKDPTLWEAVELFLNYPPVKNSKSRQRYICCLSHLVRHLGKEKPVKEIWAPQIRAYQEVRKSEGAAPGTINWETSTLRRLYGVLIELRVLEQTQHLPRVNFLTTKGRERRAYLSFQHVRQIATLSPAWFEPIVWTAYYSGMRKSEILGLTRENVDLVDRMIHLTPDKTKEGDWKRVPIRKELVPILQEAMEIGSGETNRVFLLRDEKGVRPPSHESTLYPWINACQALGMDDPRPRFHDLRHTWRANARRSKVDWVIAERIMGHAGRKLSVSEMYGDISDEELLEAIDSMTFDNGPTRVLGRRYDVDAERTMLQPRRTRDHL